MQRPFAYASLNRLCVHRRIFSYASLSCFLHASYASVFNIAWYGLKPLALGMSDVSKAPVLNDGIFFNNFEEGKVGYQPERLGPYSSTFNPGYDPTLPLYETWPLFDGIKAAFSDNYKQLDNKWKQVKDNTVQIDIGKQKEDVVWLSRNNGSDLKSNFENLFCDE